MTTRPPHKRRNEEEARGYKSRASNNQLHLTGNSFDLRTGLDGGGTAIVSGPTVAALGRGEPGDIPARSRQTGDKPGTDRIDTVGHDNRDGCGRLHGRNRVRIEPGDE